MFKIADMVCSIGLTERQLEVEKSLRDVPDTYDVDDVNFDLDMGNGFADDVLHGRTQLDISHAGEAAIDETMLEQLHKHHKCVICSVYGLCSY